MFFWIFPDDVDNPVNNPNVVIVEGEDMNMAHGIRQPGYVYLSSKCIG